MLYSMVAYQLLASVTIRRDCFLPFQYVHFSFDLCWLQYYYYYYYYYYYDYHYYYYYSHHYYYCSITITVFSLLRSMTQILTHMLYHDSL
jgi:hypothetical protein